jgi:hypothetical protein
MGNTPGKTPGPDLVRELTNLKPPPKNKGEGTRQSSFYNPALLRQDAPHPLPPKLKVQTRYRISIDKSSIKY